MWPVDYLSQGDNPHTTLQNVIITCQTGECCAETLTGQTQSAMARATMRDPKSSFQDMIFSLHELWSASERHSTGSGSAWIVPSRSPRSPSGPLTSHSAGVARLSATRSHDAKISATMSASKCRYEIVIVIRRAGARIPAPTAAAGPNPARGNDPLRPRKAPRRAAPIA